MTFNCPKSSCLCLNLYKKFLFQCLKNNKSQVFKTLKVVNNKISIKSIKSHTKSIQNVHGFFQDLEIILNFV